MINGPVAQRGLFDDVVYVSGTDQAVTIPVLISLPSSHRVELLLEAPLQVQVLPPEEPLLGILLQVQVKVLLRRPPS